MPRDASWQTSPVPPNGRARTPSSCSRRRWGGDEEVRRRPRGRLDAHVDLCADPGRHVGKAVHVGLGGVEQLDHGVGLIRVHLEDLARNGELHLPHAGGDQTGSDRRSIHDAQLRRPQHIRISLRLSAENGGVPSNFGGVAGLGAAARQALVSILASDDVILAFAASWIRAMARWITIVPVPLIRFVWAVARPWAKY